MAFNEPSDSGAFHAQAEEGDVNRSADLGVFAGMSGFGGPSAFGLGSGKDADKAFGASAFAPPGGASCFEAFDAPASGASAFGASAFGTGHAWFDAGATAPPFPSDPNFQPTPTTIVLEQASTGGEVGNHVLNLLDAEATARVTKVSPAKLCLKAEIAAQGFTTELKVRVYSHGAQHAVEFQRRSGDVVVFRLLFKRLQALLEAGASATASELVLLPQLKFGSSPLPGFPLPLPDDEGLGDAAAVCCHMALEPPEMLSLRGSPEPLTDICWGPLALAAH